MTQFGSYQEAIKIIKNIDPEQIETSTMYLVIKALEKAESEEIKAFEISEKFAWSNYKHEYCENLRDDDSPY